MSFQDCDIVFHGSPKLIVYSGQVVTGAFHIRQDESKEIQGLYFKISGKTKTRWSESHGTGKNRRTTVYSAEECNIDIGPISLLGGYPVQNGSVTIPSGLSTFNFSFTLAQGLRSSFEGSFGSTRYKMKVTAERANKFDKTKKFPFTVYRSTDLNLNLQNHVPIREVQSKHFTSFSGPNGFLEITIDLPKTGYIPEYQLPIKCLVINKSRVYISSINFSLVRDVTYFTTFPDRRIKTERHNMVVFVGRQVDKDQKSLLQEALNLPAMPPSCLDDNLINMQYSLKVKAVVTGFHSNLKTEIPVNIGTIPVYSQSYADPSTSTVFRQQLGVPSTSFYPSCPDLSKRPSPDHSAFPRPGVQPYGIPQFPQFPPLPHSNLPAYRSMRLLPTPSAPPLYSEIEKTRDDSGLPTYEECQMAAMVIKDNPEHGVDNSPKLLVYPSSPWL